MLLQCYQPTEVRSASTHTLTGERVAGKGLAKGEHVKKEEKAEEAKLNSALTLTFTPPSQGPA